MQLIKQRELAYNWPIIFDNSDCNKRVLNLQYWVADNVLNGNFDSDSYVFDLDDSHSVTLALIQTALLIMLV